MCQGELVPVDINELSPTHFVIYRFGVFVTQLLQKHLDIPEITLLLASSLPPNNYAKNAFRNSFFFERSRRILFIRQERMESVGDFIVVVLHCMAHIKIDDLIDDNNPMFLREFYKVCFYVYYMYIYMCVCVCVCVCINILNIYKYIYIYIYVYIHTYIYVYIYIIIYTYLYVL